MNHIFQELLLHLLGWGTLSLVIIALNLRIYRNPEVVERGKEELFSMLTPNTSDDRRRRLKRYRTRARIWLILALFPLSMFLLSCFNLLAYIRLQAH
jgi:hypothetical protein